MTTLLLLPVILFAGGLATRRWLLWARRDERSIEAHRSTLGLLEQVTSEHEQPCQHHLAPGPHVRIVENGNGGRMPAPRARVTAAVARRRPAKPDPPESESRPRMVFIDDSVAPPSPAPAPLPAPPALLAPSRRRRLFAPRHPQRTTIAAGVLAAVVLGAGAGAGLSLQSGGSGTHHVTADRIPAQPAPLPPTTVAAPVVTAVSTAADAATYSTSTSTIELSLLASRACWVELRGASVNGPIVFEGTLQPGAAQTFRAAGGAWLRLGNPGGVAVHIDGQPVDLPSASSPYDLSVTTSA